MPRINRPSSNSKKSNSSSSGNNSRKGESAPSLLSAFTNPSSSTSGSGDASSPTTPEAGNGGDSGIAKAAGILAGMEEGFGSKEANGDEATCGAKAKAEEKAEEKKEKKEEAKDKKKGKDKEKAKEKEDDEGEEKEAGMPFLQQDRPESVKKIYRALKRDHPEMPAEEKARIAARQGKPGKQHQGPPYKGPIKEANWLPDHPDLGKHKGNLHVPVRHNGREVGTMKVPVYEKTKHHHIHQLMRQAGGSKKDADDFIQAAGIKGHQAEKTAKDIHTVTDGAFSAGFTAAMERAGEKDPELGRYVSDMNSRNWNLGRAVTSMRMGRTGEFKTD